MSELARDDAARLLEIARASLEHGVRRGFALRLDAAAERPALRVVGASFVTLRSAGHALRGCIGTLEAHRAVALDVAENAYRAGFHDPRFEPLDASELAELQLHVSLLGRPERMEVRTEAELLAQLRPGVDGLILRLGERRATFLPEVWEQLPEPREFVRALQQKAGMAAGGWSERIEVWRYGTTAIEDAPPKSGDS